MLVYSRQFIGISVSSIRKHTYDVGQNTKVAKPYTRVSYATGSM